MTQSGFSRDLSDFGWDARWAEVFSEFEKKGLVPARVVGAERGSFAVLGQGGERLCDCAGKILKSESLRPAVGDWVALTPAQGRGRIEAVLPRRSAIVRKEAGRRAKSQVLASNVDIVFVMTSLNDDFNPRRIERWAALAWDSGAQPVLLLSKADLSAEVETKLAEAAAAAPGVPVHAVSVKSGSGLEALDQYLVYGKTAALVGTSGVGKSTLVNKLLGSAVQEVREIREDDARGRHTTTNRRIFKLPGGALLVDMPGLREIQLWDEEGVDQAFPEIEALMLQCRFSNCKHSTEPGCAVREALATGALDAGRYESWLKLAAEADFIKRKKDKGAAANSKARWKQIHKDAQARRKIEDS